MRTKLHFRRTVFTLLTLLGIVAGAKSQDMTSTPLTLEATTSGDITFSVAYSYTHPVVLTPIEYKINEGSWTTYSSWPADATGIPSSAESWPLTFGTAIHVEAGDKVAFRGTNASYYGNSKGYECHISSTADVYVYGNVMSLIHATDFATNYTMTGDWNFAKLFKLPTANAWDPPVTVTTIKSHPSNDIVLPATTLTNNCYNGLFAGCKYITKAPVLPATTMPVGCYAEMFRATGLTTAPALSTTVFQPYSEDAEGEHGSIDCYMQMFQDCTSLTTAPALNATTLVHGCYQNMFQGCTSLSTPPALPATDLTGGDQCYTAMFKGCTSLTTLPANYLPATTLDAWCYMEMFSGCTSLETAPALPATTLTEDCYHRMFEGCTSLTTAPDLPAAHVVNQSYGGMFDGCTSLNYVKCLATSFDDKMLLGDWLNNVAATGTFVKAEIVDLPRNGNGIPAGWTIQTESGVGHSETLTANSDGEATPSYWATYYNSLASVTTDANTTIYKAKVNSEKTKVTLTEVTGNTIPAGNAVVLKSTQTNITLTVTTASGTLSNNDLLGQSAPFNTPANLFALQKKTDVGFYHYPATQEISGNTYPTSFPGQKAYLIVPASARSFLGFSNGENTAIDTIEAEDTDSPLYDLTGRKVSTESAPGIYIRNGKKIIIK